jgi:hypothetical protein
VQSTSTETCNYLNSLILPGDGAMNQNRSLLLALIAFAMLSSGFNGCAQVTVITPGEDVLHQAGLIDIDIELPFSAVPATLVVVHNNGTISTDVTSSMTLNGRNVMGQLSALGSGIHHIYASVEIENGTTQATTRAFDVLDLPNAANCEVLNAAACMLPYPSDRFLEPDLTRPAGFNPLRAAISASALPSVTGPALDPAPYNELDGFSPGSQILMHFEGAGVDLAATGASRLIDVGAPISKPYVGIRTHDDTSIQSTSPSLLIDADTGEQILHFLEVDARAAGNPARQSVVMRPARTLTPGKRYIVAMRDLIQLGGAPVVAEATFAALRDFRPTTFGQIEDRRAHYEANIFPQLASAGVVRGDLLLAFDFTVQSDDALTQSMLAMRDASYTWLAGGNAAFTVDSVVENDCSIPGTIIWRIVDGSYEVPLFLTADPEANINSLGTINDPNSDGIPDQNGVTDPPYTISLPCSALLPVPPTAHSMLLGHGLFGVGQDMVTGFGDFLDGSYIAGATNFRGMSSDDLPWVGGAIIGLGSSQLNNFPAFAARLKQGQINTLTLSRMMKHGLFNTHPCFEIRSPLPPDCTLAGPDPLAVGVFPGSPSVDVEMFYFGVSLGGIMGTWYAALTEDTERFNVDVPAANFGILLQRSTQFATFDTLLNSIGLSDPMDKILGLGLIHELWASSEPTGYLHQLAPEIASTDKNLMVTVAWLDKQVSNQATEIMVRSLGISNHEGSVQQGLVGIPDTLGAQDSAMVIYDTGSFDLFNPLHLSHIPPLANIIPSSTCDPHGGPRISIPASLDQAEEFLQPGGQVVNFCTGICDGVEVSDQPAGGPCDPLNP